jgi:hypothetical protein
MLIVIAATASGRGSVLFLIGVLFWVGPILGFTVTVMRALQRYLKHYLARRNLPAPLSAEARWQAQMELLRVFGKASPHKGRTYNQPKHAIEMDHERHVARRFALLIIIWTFIGWLILYGLVALALS